MIKTEAALTGYIEGGDFRTIIQGGETINLA
jgi:hypothetical protein